jgi:hypothetical protein
MKLFMFVSSRGLVDRRGSWCADGGARSVNARTQAEAPFNSLRPLLAKSYNDALRRAYAATASEFRYLPGISP